MDASSRRVLGMISEMNVRYVVPVYQRPYSWGREQCAQLWDDVLACGRSERAGATHFTGSIVTVQDGSLSTEGVASLMLIDGQQRVATITLLLIALARHAAAREAAEAAGHADPRGPLSFTSAEIVDGGFLTNVFRNGADHYKLTLSKGDEPVLRALVDALEGPVDTVPAAIPTPSHITENLALFERRLSALSDVDAVWRGLQRLEVVSIALEQGRDDPQLIFESMNSTGKDLSSADLMRNFVLMGRPLARQQELYRDFWRPVEEALGADAYDERFDAFARAYLTVACAPQTFAQADIYQALKHHAAAAGYTRDDRMAFFCMRLRDHAHRYMAATTGAVADEELARPLARIARLHEGSVVPLEMALLEATDRRQLEHAGLVRCLALLETYLMRRSVCGLERSVLPGFFASLIGRLDAVRERSGNIPEALEAMVLGESETPRRMPGDAEFGHALKAGDVYYLGDALALLAGIGDDAVPEEGHVVERVMPPLALRSDAWRAALGPEPERSFEAHVNSLGNLAICAADFELQEASLAEQQARLAAEPGGPLAGSADVLAATEWTPAVIEARTARMAASALAAWPLPQLPEATLAIYRPRHARAEIPVSFADLFAAGLVQMDDRLVSASPLYPGRATVTARGLIMLENGETFDDPTAAYERFLLTLGTEADGANGWTGWRRGAGGPLLDALREQLL